VFFMLQNNVPFFSYHIIERITFFIERGVIGSILVLWLLFT
jgi:hypothetical protein